MNSLTLQDELAKTLWEHEQWEPFGVYLDLVNALADVLEKHDPDFDWRLFDLVAYYGKPCMHSMQDWYIDRTMMRCQDCDETYEEPYS